MISNSLKRTLLEMAFGFVIYEIILAVVFSILSKTAGYSFVSLFLGYTVGIILSVYIILDMAITIENVIDLNDPAYAQKTMLHAGIRKAVLIAVIVVALNLKFINTIAIVLTLFGIKAGAYLQPYAHKICGNKTKKPE